MSEQYLNKPIRASIPMKDALKLILVPAVGAVGIALIFIMVIWAGSWYDEVVNEGGENPSGSRDIAGYASFTVTDSCSTEPFYVCGFDGVTYINACQAVRNGTSVAHRGNCGMPS